jgi:hypothetical protein
MWYIMERGWMRRGKGRRNQVAVMLVKIYKLINASSRDKGGRKQPPSLLFLTPFAPWWARDRLSTIFAIFWRLARFFCGTFRLRPGRPLGLASFLFLAPSMRCHSPSVSPAASLQASSWVGRCCEGPSGGLYTMYQDLKCVSLDLRSGAYLLRPFIFLF